jgi:hypothetical protein
MTAAETTHPRDMTEAERDARLAELTKPKPPAPRVAAYGGRHIRELTPLERLHAAEALGLTGWDRS